MAASTIECTSARCSFETCHNVPETINPLSNPLSPSDSPVHKLSSTHRKGSSLVSSNLKMGSLHIRCPSGPNAIAQVQPSSKLLSGAINPRADMMPNALNSYNSSREISSQSLIGSPPSDKVLVKQKSIQLNLDSPSQEPISGKYLPKILQTSERKRESFRGNHPGSSTVTPKSDEILEKGKYRVGTKRGSFSVFRKAVENEFVKSP